MSENFLLNYVFAFLSGVLVSFSPCVYPVLPLTASFIAGANTKGTKLKGFILSLIYVLGVAVTYSVLGIVAALSGKVFGQFQNSALVYLIVGNILFFFALVMFDVIALPTFGGNLQGKVKPTNLFTVFLFGAVSGLVIGPCTAPVLGTLLVYVGTKQNLFYGATLLFVFSYGVGASLILVGTFSGILSSLPKSGPWLIRVKQLCGAVLLLIAEYFFIKAGGLM